MSTHEREVLCPVCSSLQRWLGRPSRGGGGIRTGGCGRPHCEAAVRRGLLLRWLLPEAQAQHQHAQPVVPGVLAVPLSVPDSRTPSRELELCTKLLRLVKQFIRFSGWHFLCTCAKKKKNCSDVCNAQRTMPKGPINWNTVFNYELDCQRVDLSIQ